MYGKGPVIAGNVPKQLGVIRQKPDLAAGLITESIRVDAEARFRETEQRLQNDLAETERRLRELQSTREDSENILLSREQQQEIDRFVDQRASIRKDLRAVQRGLDRDIEQLGTVLKMVNIGLVPLLLTVFVLIAVWRRTRGVGA